MPDFFLYIPCRSFRRQHPLYSLLLLRCARMYNHILHKRRLSTYDFLFLTLLYHSNHISFHALSWSVSIFLFQYDYLHLFLHTQYGKYHKLPSAYRLHFLLYVHTDNYKLCTHHFPNHVLHLLILPYRSSHIFSDVFLLSVPILHCRYDLQGLMCRILHYILCRRLSFYMLPLLPHSFLFLLLYIRQLYICGYAYHYRLTSTHHIYVLPLLL